MRTAIDWSVLIAVLRRTPDGERWRDAWDAAAQDGPLLVCPVVFAECACGYPDLATARCRLEAVLIQYDCRSPAAAYLAGHVFVRSRTAGGPRKHLIPDFLIPTHAAVQADQLAAVDRGYFRRYFPQLRIVPPHLK